MKPELTLKEFRSKGGKARWAKIGKKQRSQMMSDLAKLRHKKLADKRVGK